MLLLLSLPVLARSQNDFPRDTSFTVWSAWQKIKAEFPQAVPVKPIASDRFLSLPDQVYRVRNNRLLHMDVFIPNAEPGPKRPAVLLIHGGGWRSGSKSHQVPMAQQLAADGYVAAAVEYRLSAEALYPAGMYDVTEAIRFLKHQAAVYGIDTTRVAVLGCSSGAQQASLLATTGNLTRFDDPQSAYPHHSARVQALINIDGVVDFTTPEESAKDENPDKPSAGAMWFGATFKQSPEKWIEASPVRYAGKDTPPTLFVNSALPRFHAGRDEFFGILDRHGIYHEQHTIEATPHPFWLFHPWFEETHQTILNFLTSIFQKNNL